mgnify:CR=1 FL=1
MNTKQDLVSVIMPAFNAEKYIVESINSIINQTYKEWELIIINDGSSDKTASIIKEFSTKDSRIISLENEENKGLVYTRNRGLKEAKGTFIANLDSDDIAYPERLEKQVEFMVENPQVVLLGTACETIDSKGNQIGIEKRAIPKEHLKSLLVFSNYFINSSIILRKALVQNCFYQEDFAPAEDYQFFTQIMDNGEIVNLPEVLVKYRIHDQNISVLKKKEQESSIKRIQEKLLSKIEIKASEEELNLHASLVNEGGSIAEQELEFIETWLQQLKSSNNKVKKYNQHVFDHFCAFFYRRACLNAKMGFKSIKKYRNSSLSKSLKNDWKGNSIFMIKLLLNRA